MEQTATVVYAIELSATQLSAILGVVIAVGAGIVLSLSAMVKRNNHYTENFDKALSSLR